MLQAIYDTVIVRPILQSASIGNIIIPQIRGKINSSVDSGLGEYQQYYGYIYGVIESIGPKYKNTFQGRLLQRGDKILFQRHEGKQIIYDRQRFLKLREASVLAVIDEEAKNEENQ